VASPRILHAPSDVGGHAYGLSRAERALGLESDVAVLAAGPFGYAADIRIEVEGLPILRRFARRAAFLRRALRRYDIFHFNFGNSLVAMHVLGHVFDELSLIKRAGKTVLVTFQGCDVRPRSACACRRAECVANDRYRAPNAARFARHADRIFHVNPDLRHWLPNSRFVPYANVDPRSFRFAPAGPRETMVVAHAPTDRDVKGTRHVIEAVEALREGGLAVELDLIEGVPSKVAQRRLMASDVVVDQLMIGWYGGVAVEAMALGKPVLCYIREQAAEDNPFGEALPILRTTAAMLAEDLRALALDEPRRRDAAAAGRSFVQTHHDPRRIARRVLDGYVALPDPA
jgi:glycosyltransferase involved in cell wall biosynthesis